MIGLLSPVVLRAVAVAAILAALAWGYHLWADHQREIGRQEVRAEWQADKLARAESTRLLLMARDKETATLQGKADKERQALNEKNRTIGRDLAAALERMRDRPERPADRAGGVPENPGAPTAGPGDGGCTGAGLFRDDSAVLVRLASDANRLRAALRSCRADYERAAATVNGGTDASMGRLQPTDRTGAAVLTGRLRAYQKSLP